MSKQPWDSYFKCVKRTYLNGDVWYVIIDLTEEYEVGAYPDAETAQERLGCICSFALQR